jgi:hypothetical protein
VPNPDLFDADTTHLEPFPDNVFACMRNGYRLSACLQARRFHSPDSQPPAGLGQPPSLLPPSSGRQLISLL